MTGEVIIAELNNSIEQVQGLFVQYDMHHIPVVDNEQVIGIISQTDLLKCYDQLLKSGESVNAGNMSSKFRVEEIMTAKPLSIAPVTSLETASDIMVKHHCHALPVVEHGKIVGILTPLDIVNFVSKMDD